MKSTPCTIHDCEFDSYVKGVIINNKVYAFNEYGFLAPARDYICEHVDYGMVQFYIGFYDGYEDDTNTSKWGFFNFSDGEIIVMPVYDVACPFYGDRAQVKKNGKYGFLAPDGSIAIEIVWDSCECSFRSGLCPVKRGWLWGYIDKYGTVVVQPRFEVANEFDNIKDGIYRALVKMDGKYGYIDDMGQYIYEPTLDDAKLFWKKGYAPVKENGLWGFIDLKGNLAVDFQFDKVGEREPYEYYDYDFYLIKKDGQWGIIDENLNVFLLGKRVRYFIYESKVVFFERGRITKVRELP